MTNDDAIPDRHLDGGTGEPTATDSPAVTIRQDDAAVTSPWSFFYSVSDVTELNPAEEQGEPWEAVLDSEAVGMAMVDTSFDPPYHIDRVAVLEDYRRQGIATRLLERIKTRHGRVTCRVRTNNSASQTLVESVGFARTGDSRWPSLYYYDTDSD